MSSYRSQIGAAGVYYGVSDTQTNWPANMGSSFNVNAFMVGFVGTYLSGASTSTLKRRTVGAYSNVKASLSSGRFAIRITTGGRQVPARIGPVPAAIGLASPQTPY